MNLGKWHESWKELMWYKGRELQNSDEKISKVIQHWAQPIPEEALVESLSIRKRLLDNNLRYTRGYGASANRGEYALERQILLESHPYGQTKLIDGINGVNLGRGIVGQRRKHAVEADLLLVEHHKQGMRLIVGEVKKSDQNAWYAVIENLRELKLVYAQENRIKKIFESRGLHFDEKFIITGAVIAPYEFYIQKHKKANATKLAKKLIEEMSLHHQIVIELLIWQDGNLLPYTI